MKVCGDSQIKIQDHSKKDKEPKHNPKAVEIGVQVEVVEDVEVVSEKVAVKPIKVKSEPEEPKNEIAPAQKVQQKAANKEIEEKKEPKASEGEAARVDKVPQPQEVQEPQKRQPVPAALLAPPFHPPMVDMTKPESQPQASLLPPPSIDPLFMNQTFGGQP